jgi:hypothetical protein
MPSIENIPKKEFTLDDKYKTFVMGRIVRMNYGSSS